MIVDNIYTIIVMYYLLHHDNYHVLSTSRMTETSQNYLQMFSTITISECFISIQSCKNCKMMLFFQKYRLTSLLITETRLKFSNAVYYHTINECMCECNFKVNLRSLSLLCKANNTYPLYLRGVVVSLTLLGTTPAESRLFQSHGNRAWNSLLYMHNTKFHFLRLS